MNRSFFYRWLLLVVGFAGAFGLAMVVAPGPIEDFFNWMIFGSPSRPENFSADAADYIRFTYGVLGATMLGWMVLTAAVAAGPLKRGETWAWTAVVASIASWFVIDTAHSLLAGYPENAVFNTVFALVLAVPLAGLRPSDQHIEARREPR